MSERSEPIDLDYTDQIGATDKAIRFLFDTGDEVWIPKSQIQGDDTKRKVLTIPRWLAEERGLI